MKKILAFILTSASIMAISGCSVSFNVPSLPTELTPTVETVPVISTVTEIVEVIPTSEETTATTSVIETTEVEEPTEVITDVEVKTVEETTAVVTDIEVTTVTETTENITIEETTVSILPTETTAVISVEETEPEVQKISVGDTVTIGRFKGEDLEWTVLNIEDGKALITLNKIVTNLEYRETVGMAFTTEANWKASDARYYLNNDFYDRAFNDEDKEKICETEVVINTNLDYFTSAGENTYDNIFLLSIFEVEDFFASKRDRICNYEGTPAYYWLRDSGESFDYAACVDEEGNILYGGAICCDYELGLRPAMWISIE